MNQFDALSQALDARYTCRQFRPEQVEHDTIERLLALAQRTASWSNTQPWQVVVTEGAATDRFRKAIFEQAVAAPIAPDFDFPAGYPGVTGLRRKECGLALYKSVGIEKTDHERRIQQFMRNFELFDAPHVAIVTTEADLGVYGAIDCGLYIDTFLLGAQSLGIATAAQAAIAGHAPFVREYFDLPETRKVVCGISFGYADDAHPVNGFRTSRAPLDDVVTWHA